MPIDTTVQGDPVSLRATANWVRNLAGLAHDAGTWARGAVRDSESGWHGLAGDGFRANVTRAVGELDLMSEIQVDTAGALEAHATDLDTVHARMAQARLVASVAGLPILDNKICEPTDQAAPDFDAKVIAYEECRITVTEADTLEKQSQSNLEQFLGELTDRWSDWWSNSAAAIDASTGSAGTYIESRVGKLNTVLNRLAVETDVNLIRTNASGITSPGNWLHLNDTRLEWALADRRRTSVSRQVTALVGPQYGIATKWQIVRALAMKTIGDPNMPGLNFTSKVVKSVPLVGLGLTALNTTIDIIRNPTWENAVISVGAGSGSLIAATAVGVALASSPVIVPIAAGMLTGLVVDAAIRTVGDDVIDFAKDAVTETKDAVTDVVDAGKDVAKDITNTGKDMAKSLVPNFSGF